MTNSSNCPTEAALIDYAANRATPDDTDRIDTHLTLCHKCRAAIEWLRAHNILRAHSSDNSTDDSISRDLSGASASIGGGGNGDGGDNSSDNANPLEEASTKSGSNPVSGASASGGENRPDDASPSGGSSSSGSSNSSDGASASANSPSRSSEGAAESGAGKREGGQLSYHIPGGVEVTSEHLPPLFDRRILSPAGDPKAMGRLGKYDVFKILGQGGFGS
ncbi:MAG TPA: hypothetical protein PLV92_03315, partial [Pirellulaceae bacterium]|nr:hypothetical protein [Pirellulaceae bacterium]